MEVLKEKNKSEKVEIPKSLKEAMEQYQLMNVVAIADKNNPHFQSSYADLKSVIMAVKQGAKLGLTFKQEVEYKNIILKKVKTENGSVIEYQELHRDIFVRTVVEQRNDNKTSQCTVPVLVNGNDKDNPQKMGSAITYAKRYGLQSLYGLASDDDANEASKKEISK